MTIDRFFVDPVTIIRAGAGDNGYGGNALDWDNPDRTDVLGWLTDTSTTELTDARDALVSQWKLFLPAGTEIGGRDRVEAKGLTFEVIGIPSSAGTPHGEHHIEALLSLVTG